MHILIIIIMMCYRWLDYSRFGRPIKDTKIIAIKCPMKEVVVVVVLFHNSITGVNTEQLSLNDILCSNCDLTQLHYLI